MPKWRDYQWLVAGLLEQTAADVELAVLQPVLAEHGPEPTRKM